jgi:hypothetical protein
LSAIDTTELTIPSVYVETTVPSYLVARPSRDLIVAAHQRITIDWWDNAKTRFACFLSEAALAELKSGDAQFAAQRLDAVAGFGVLARNDDVDNLIRHYHKHLGLGGSAIADLPHFAFSVAYNIDYLVTWNCKHIANGQVIRRLARLNSELGRSTPIIVTPEELSAGLPGDHVS